MPCITPEGQQNTNPLAAKVAAERADRINERLMKSAAEAAERQKKRRDYETMLHILRNPYGWDEEVVRAVRLRAADELEVLTSQVQQLRTVMLDMRDILNSNNS